MSEAQKIPRGAICHIELPAPDLAAAQAFYGGLFGWQFEPMFPGYALFRDGIYGGALDASAPVADGGAVLVLAVDDIDAKLAEIEAHGGRRLTPKTEIGGGHGFYAYFRDPCGNKMGVWQNG